MIPPRQGQRIVWLVRVLTVIGLVIVVSTTGLVGWTLAKVRAERVRVTAVQRRLDRASQELREHAAQARTEIQNILDETVAQWTRPHSAAAKLVDLIHEQVSSCREPAVRPALLQVRKQMSLLTDLEARAHGWRASYSPVWEDLRQQQSMGQVREMILQLRTAVETLEGQRRLREAVAYKRWRGAVGAEANRQAETILVEHARRQSEGANDFKSDLAECARLVELLGGEEQIDNLADLKDNRLTPVLDRLLRTVTAFRQEETGLEALPPRAIENLTVALFGLRTGRQSPGSGGLFMLRHQALRLRREREWLREELAASFQAIEAANTDFAQSTQILTTGLTQQMEQSLGTGWRRLVIFGGCSSALFFWLAWMISRGIKGQVDTIEHARAEAEAGRQKTHQLMLEQQTAAAALAAAHQEVQASKRLQELIFNAVGEGIHWIDREGRIVFENPTAARLLGWAPAELIGQSAYATLHRTRADASPYPQSDCPLHAGLRDGVERHVDNEVFCRKDGTMFPVEYTCTPVREGTGGVVGAVIVFADITERKRAEAELDKTQQELREISRMAGMAEVATGVLHNVGNVLNSVNVSSICVTDGIRKSKAASLSKVVALLRGHEADLGAFFTHDPKGKQLTDYLEQLAGHLAGERAVALTELAGLQKNIEHIKDIVSRQQHYAVVSGVAETVQISDLVEDALQLNVGSVAGLDLETIREFADVPPISIEKHKVLQILVNLISNAKNSCHEFGRPDKRMTVRVTSSEGRIRIAITDNGMGIPEENLICIFNHGFTTRKTGHGFGLHSGALAAKQLGGALNVHSDGPGRGATFTLELPCRQA